MQSIRNKRKLLTILAVIIVASVLCITAAYIAVRSVIPKVTEHQYKQDITAAYDTLFSSELQNKLAEANIVMPPAEPVQCNNGPYSPSDPCHKYTSVDVVLDRTSWQTQSRALDRYLANNGWTPYINGQYMPFSDFLNNQAYYQVYASYSKTHRGVECSLTAERVNNPGYETHINIGQYCDKMGVSPIRRLPFFSY